MADISSKNPGWYLPRLTFPLQHSSKGNQYTTGNPKQFHLIFNFFLSSSTKTFSQSRISQIESNKLLSIFNPIPPYLLSVFLPYLVMVSRCNVQPLNDQIPLLLLLVKCRYEKHTLKTAVCLLVCMLFVFRERLSNCWLPKVNRYSQDFHYSWAKHRFREHVEQPNPIEIKK